MTLAEKKLIEKKKLKDITLDIIILSAVGIIGLVVSIVLAVLPDIVGPHCYCCSATELHSIHLSRSRKYS